MSRVDPQDVKEADFSPAVIFGGRNKLSADGPFLELLREFGNSLSECTILTIIGYSFRDPHVNIHIARWFNSDQTKKIRIVNGPNFEQELSDGFYPDFANSVARLVETGRVEIIPMTAREGISHLYGAIPQAVNISAQPVSQNAFERVAEEGDNEEPEETDKVLDEASAD